MTNASAARPRRARPVAVVAFLLPVVGLLIATRLWPFVSTLNDAFGPGWDVAGTLRDLWRSPRFVDSLTTTLWFSVLINPLQVLGALALAVLLTQHLPATGLCRTLVFTPVAVPPAVATIVWGIALRSPDGIVNGIFERIGFQPQPFLISPGWALWSVILVASWVGLGYWMMFLIAGLRDIPTDVIEAASIDGANAWRRFWHVIIPLLRRPLTFVLVAATVANFLLFVQVQLLTQGGPARSTNLMMFEIYQRAFTFADRQSAAAAVVVLLAIMTAVVGVQARLLSRGAT